ncbi:hypothetical protein AK812_SmicGene47956 [Symbiodinium microadriaticum]|uniref:Uncharacterized protein n=1 Tax=Symbiodinium microadriaticum TaxID=2951 RepID=A0A1Q9BQL6_SYMMI|nr:hypothetical protein AK812_SmicGene47956 [Symbiodinium microadriaticum]
MADPPYGEPHQGATVISPTANGVLTTPTSAHARLHEEHATSYLVDIRYGPAVQRQMEEYTMKYQDELRALQSEVQKLRGEKRVIFSKELQFNSNLIVLQISFKEIHVVLKGVFT